MEYEHCGKYLDLSTVTCEKVRKYHSQDVETHAIVVNESGQSPPIICICLVAMVSERWGEIWLMQKKS